MIIVVVVAGIALLAYYRRDHWSWFDLIEVDTDIKWFDCSGGD